MKSKKFEAIMSVVMFIGTFVLLQMMRHPNWTDMLFFGHNLISVIFCLELSFVAATFGFCLSVSPWSFRLLMEIISGFLMAAAMSLPMAVFLDVAVIQVSGNTLQGFGSYYLPSYAVCLPFFAGLVFLFQGNSLQGPELDVSKDISESEA